MIRIIAFIGAFAGGAGMSQFPEYSQQYEQRLAGGVDEMRVVVANFDRTLAELDQTREEAFAPGQDLSPREAKLLENAKRDINRLSFLEDALARLRGAPMLQRLMMAPAIADRQIAARAWQDFAPAVPLTVAGLACAGLGAIFGWILILMIGSILAFTFGMIFRRTAA